MSGKPCLLFLIHSLAAGGAERQLCELVGHLDRARFELHVLVFYEPGQGNGGELWPEIASLPDVGLHSLNKRRGPLGYLIALPRTLGLIWRVRPDILHGYSDGNLAALLLGVLFHKRVVWGIRRTSKDQSKMDRLSLRLQKVSVWLSRFVDLIIFNSEAGRLNHQRMGMRSPRMLVVTNGFDITRFSPDAVQGAAQRQRWGVPDDVPLIGIVGRLDPVKDHPTFLRAAARLIQEWPTATFVCVGGGSVDYAKTLQMIAESLGISDRILWPGICSQMSAVYNALSILVLSSTDEGFPNVVGEAMACGIPCVATKVGDAAPLIADTGFTVEIGDDEAIANAVSILLHESEDAHMSRVSAARQRICTFFSVETLARNTERSLLELLSNVSFKPTRQSKKIETIPSSPDEDSPATQRLAISESSKPNGLNDSNPAASPVLATKLHDPLDARYLLRFDDICSTMKWSIWNELEPMLIDMGVSPILSIVPDNRDPNLMIDPPAPDFWDHVRNWQARGWAIGLHGYQHSYVNRKSGILRLNSRSEFAGLEYAVQYEKLSQGLEIFAREGVRADTWVAPAHSFDWVTLSALNALGIRIISDGLSLTPYQDFLGNVWVPQQFATMRRMPLGVWTYCYHLNRFSSHDLRIFNKSLAQLQPKMISLPEAAAMGNRSCPSADRLVWMIRKSVSAIRHPSSVFNT